MADKTNISWTGTTWNPTVGCSLMSPGCTNCYAMKMAARLEAMGGGGLKYAGLTRKVNGRAVWNGLVRLDPAALMDPMTKWKTPRLIFVNSMSDLFHVALSWCEIDQVFAVMAICGQHTFQVLTKRPDRMREYLNDPATRTRIEFAAASIKPGFKMRAWPLDHVWAGTSVEDQTRCEERVPILLQTQAAIRFVSIEPMLSEVILHAAASFSELRAGLHWIIAGGESGPDARPMHPNWARAIRHEANLLGIPFFFKQHGQFTERDPGGNRRPIGVMWNGSQVPAGTPQSTTIWSVGATAAGDVLDGRVWHQYPVGFISPGLRRSVNRSHQRGDDNNWPTLI